MKKFLLVLAAAFFLSTSAAAQSLVGTYRLVSFYVSLDGGPPKDYFGAAPKGYIILTPSRLMTVITAGNRKYGKSIDEKAALLDTLLAYTGPYRVEGGKLITAVDVSSSEAWTGSQQARTYRVEGNRLTLITDPAPSFADPKKSLVATLVWEKID